MRYNISFQERAKLSTIILSKQPVIVEDLHDENVLTQDGMLYFIDTVFYIV